MARGGKREGSGRKPGQATKVDAAARLKAAEEGLMPLDYMLSVLRNEEEAPQVRFAAAQAAAPYLHAKLASKDVKHSGDVAHRIVFETLYEKRPDGKGKA